MRDSGLRRLRPYCPHLGAHPGHGGTVRGENLVCPCHHFRFDPEGACVRTGYGTAPPRARPGRIEHRRPTDWSSSGGTLGGCRRVGNHQVSPLGPPVLQRAAVRTRPGGAGGADVAGAARANGGRSGQASAQEGQVPR
ncbi:Rieske 2Fe-2S domain-containing protein [Streptomyces youssoufiensis]